MVKPTKMEKLAFERVEGLAQRYGKMEPTFDNVQSAVVAVAESLTGVEEVGRTNTGYFVDIITRQLGITYPIPWCVAFVQWDIRKACSFFNIKDILPHNSPSTQSVARWAELAGLATIDVSKAGPGTIIVFRDGDGHTGHMELITSARPENYTAVGGNTNSEISRDGGDVAMHLNVPWMKYGPVGVPRKNKRWTRCLIPLEGLYEMYYKVKE